MSNPLRQGAVVITGATSGIGYGVASDFVEAGRQVVGIARNATSPAAESLCDLARRIGAPSPVMISADVKNLDAITDASREVESRGILVSSIVAAAGINIRKPAQELTGADVSSMLETNLAGAFHTLQVFSKGMLKKRGARFISIGSVSGSYGMQLRSIYSATKAAMEGLTRSLAIEWAGNGATVNCVAPGIVDTPLTRGYLDKNPDLEARVDDATLAGRLGTVKDVVNVVRFLESDGSDFITGQTIVVDGGLSVGNSWW